MVDILNLALPYFGLIFIGFACGKAKGLPEQGLAWMNFFLLYGSLPALLFGIALTDTMCRQAISQRFIQSLHRHGPATIGEL
jgi:predicted permease